MDYKAFVDYCLGIYKESLEKCPQTDLKVIVIGNLHVYGCAYDEETISDICYSIKEKMK